MKIGLWNVDHPEAGSGSKRKQQRFDDVIAYLAQAGCDACVITEANSAMCLDGYSAELSLESPFRSSGRCYDSPNFYHQVAIYSKLPMSRNEVGEPVNSLQVSIGSFGDSFVLYGNVITIKDQWSKTSNLTYSDRLNQQISAIEGLPRQQTIVAGDFNLRIGWPQKLSAHERIRNEVAKNGWIWPTEMRDETVQHVLHTNDLQVSLDFDFSVMYSENRSSGLSDHPFVEISTSPNTKTKSPFQD